MIEKIKRIKELRRKPEEKFLVDILDNVEFVYDDEYTESEFYRVDDEVLFEQDSKNNWFWVHYEKVWSVLDTSYGLNEQEIKDLVQLMVWERLKKKVYSPIVPTVVPLRMVWERLKKKV